MPRYVTLLICLVISQLLALNFVSMAEASHRTKARMHACNQIKNVKWKAARSTAYMHFVNHTKSVATLSYINSKGQPRKWRTVQPGKAIWQYTYLTLSWLVTDAKGTCLGIFEATTARRSHRVSILHPKGSGLQHKCAKQKSLRWTKYYDRTQLEITNNTKHPVGLYIIDWRGQLWPKQRPYRTLMPGDVLKQGTYLTLPWVAVSYQKASHGAKNPCLGIFEGTERVSRISIGKAPTTPQIVEGHGEFTPGAIFTDEAATLTVAVNSKFRAELAHPDAIVANVTTHGNFPKLHLQAPPDQWPPWAGNISPDENFRLYDDGTHGDVGARDGVYTREGLTVGGPYDWMSTCAQPIQVPGMSGKPRQIGFGHSVLSRAVEGRLITNAKGARAMVQAIVWEGTYACGPTLWLALRAVKGTFKNGDAIIVPDHTTPQEYLSLGEVIGPPARKGGSFTPISSGKQRLENEGRVGLTGVTVRGLLKKRGSHPKQWAEGFSAPNPATGKPENVRLAKRVAKLGVVNKDLRGKFPVKQLSKSVSVTEDAMFIADPQIMQGYPNPNIWKLHNPVECEACAILWKQYGDIFDFLIVQTRINTGGNAGYVRVKDQIDGIGLRKKTTPPLYRRFFDNKLHPKLRGILFLGERTASPLTHELGHGWGVEGGTTIPSKALRVNYGNVNKRTGAVTPGGGHIGGGHPGNAQIPGHATGWNTTVHGQMSGDFGHSRVGGSAWDLCPRLLSMAECRKGPSWIQKPYLQLLPANPFCLTNACLNPMKFKVEPTVYDRMLTFSWLELYIMGLVDAQGKNKGGIPFFKKTPHYYSVGGKLDLTDLKNITAEKVESFTIQDWINVHGVRNPPAGKDQTNFQLGVMVLSDRPFSEAEYAYWSIIYARHSSGAVVHDGFGPPPWHAATRGLSRVTTKLP